LPFFHSLSRLVQKISLIVLTFQKVLGIVLSDLSKLNEKSLFEFFKTAVL